MFSVVIPTYNRADSLGVTLNGLARQEDVDGLFEVIVVSDGSTDATAERVQAFALQAPFSLRFFEQKNQGPARARNYGVEQAKGEVIVFLDDDVEPMPHCLAAHAKHHTENNIAVIGPMLRDPARASQEPPWISWEHELLEQQYENWNKGVWQSAGPNHFYTGNASLRRAHIVSVGGFNETFRRQEDVELAYRMYHKCNIRFLFDRTAEALHRPMRSFDSWLKAPFAYGLLDVERITQGDLPGTFLSRKFEKSHRISRTLTQIGLQHPQLLPYLYKSLRSMATALYRLPKGNKASQVVLSSLYNVRYFEGASKAAGDRNTFDSLINSSKSETPTNS